ncbi:MAG TPA: amidohydrolase family protein, partial [Methylomirabilota bacterium]|nr:amidohydrolase family protein [Methylomirabilota bacterium]
MRIDSHQHFWQYDPREYPWMTGALAALRRDHLPSDLEPLLEAAGVDGCVAVQARQTLAESRWLLNLTDHYPMIRGVVGWVDLRGKTVDRELEELARHPRFVGVRHVAQDEPDDEFLTGEEFVRGVGRLKDFDLAYDILIYPRQLPAAIRLVERLPEQRFVLDHLG